MSKQSFSLTIKNITPETDQAASISFSIPDALKDTFRYKPGQYLTFVLHIHDREVRRSYSMSSAPYEEDLQVTIKRVEGGLVSNYLLDRMKPGDSLQVMPPQGRFTTTIKEENRKTYYFFGAGSGITPLMSLIKTILEEEPQSSVFLLYGNRNENSIIFKDSLKDLETKYAGQFIVQHILSQPLKKKASGLSGFFKKPTSSWAGAIGRIDHTHILRFMDENPKTYEDTEYFICGPGNMIDRVESALLQMGMDKKRIHTERFLTAKDNTTSNTTATSATEAAAKKLIVHLDGEEIQINIPKGKTILEAIIAEGYEPPYSCRSGSCASCMGKVLKGSVQMEACYALDDDEIADGFILTCQAHPTTEELEVSFDI